MCTSISSDVHGFFFIIPNNHEIIRNDSLMAEFHNSRVEELGLDNWMRLIPGDKPIGIWTYGDGSDNWSDHNLPQEEDKRFVSFVPYRVIRHMLEGDELIISSDSLKKRFILTAKQKGSRYERFGNFNQVRNDLTRDMNYLDL